MAGGIMIVTEFFAGMAKGAALVAEQTREATAEVEAYNAELRETAKIENTFSSMAKAKGGGASTMGSGSGSSSGGAGMPKAVTVAGTMAALAVTRGRSR